jgi:hypothetical protein
MGDGFPARSESLFMKEHTWRFTICISILSNITVESSNEGRHVSLDKCYQTCVTTVRKNGTQMTLTRDYANGPRESGDTEL